MGNDFDLYLELVKTNFKLRYKGSVLGFLWVLMKPFLLFLILYIVFSKLSGSRGQLSSNEYAIYLLSGLIVFTLFNEGIIMGMNSLKQRSKLILKINFNRFIAILSSITIALINFFINIIILGIISVVIGVGITWGSFLYMLLVLFTLLAFLLGISLFTSIALIRLRDLSHITQLGMRLIFYASTIFMPIDVIPAKWQFIVRYNPVAVFVGSFRSALMYGHITRFKFILALLAFSIAMIITGRWFFRKNVKEVAEHF
jgi:ABC-2 type transport system permease protein